MKNKIKKSEVRYDFIDIGKFIATIMVLSIHIHPFKDISPQLSFIWDYAISRLAVPFFFVSSSFLLFRKLNLCDDKNQKKIILKKYLFRILTLYFIWSIVYFPSIYSSWNESGLSIYKNIILYIRDILFLGSYGHLWYFPALVFAILLLYILHDRFKVHYILIFGFMLYLVGMIYNIMSVFSILPKNLLGFIYTLYKYIFMTTRNGLFLGFIFVCIGYLYSVNPSISIMNIKFKKYTIISIFLLIIESLLLKNGRDYGLGMYIMLIPSIYFLFGLLLNFNINITKNFILMTRNISTLIYVNQFIIINFFNNIEYIASLNSIVYFILIFISSILFSILIIKVSKYKYFKFLRYSY